MIVIRTESQLKLIGKAWEIKSKLKELAKSSKTVKEYLQLFQG